MAAFQTFFREYLEEKLNSTNNLILAPANLKFKLYNRYGIDEQEFFDTIVESIDWDTPESPGIPTNNVVIDFEDDKYNTQLGQYKLTQIKYVPAIIEDFIAEFEPLDFVKNANYTIPVTFYVNETVDRQLDNIIIKAIQKFQDEIRGKVNTYYDDISGADFKFLLTHSGYSPLTGIIDFNGTVFREYQLIISLELIDKGFFTNQIQYNLSVPEFFGTSEETERFASLGIPFPVHPIAAMSTRASELHQFQKFSTSTEDAFEVKALANEVGFMMELSFLYDGDLFSRFLYKLRYTPTLPKRISLQVVYPGLTSSLEIPETIDYLIESIGGLENVGEKIIISIVLKPVSTVGLGIGEGNVNPPFPVEEGEQEVIVVPEEPTEPEEPVEEPVEEPTPEITQTFVVTVQNVNGVNVYFIDGVERPLLYLLTNNTYVFDQSDSTNTNHPLRFRDANNISYTQGVVATGTPGTAGAKVSFTVPFNVPDNLRYYCTVHGNAMGNNIIFAFGEQ